jgi:hypothetical protein
VREFDDRQRTCSENNKEQTRVHDPGPGGNKDPAETARDRQQVRLREATPNLDAGLLHVQGLLMHRIRVPSLVLVRHCFQN